MGQRHPEAWSRSRSAGLPGSHLLEELQSLAISVKSRDVRVTLVSARARLRTNPAPTGSPEADITIGILFEACRVRGLRPDPHDDVDLLLRQFLGQGCEALLVQIGEPRFQRDVARPAFLTRLGQLRRCTRSGN